MAAYGNRGLTYTAKADFDRAIADFTQVIQLDPKDAKAYYNRGLAYNKMGDTDRASADFAQAIQLDPKYAAAAPSRETPPQRVGQDSITAPPVSSKPPVFVNIINADEPSLSGAPWSPKKGSHS